MMCDWYKAVLAPNPPQPQSSTSSRAQHQILAVEVPDTESQNSLTRDTGHQPTGFDPRLILKNPNASWLGRTQPFPTPLAYDDVLIACMLNLAVVAGQKINGVFLRCVRNAEYGRPQNSYCGGVTEMRIIPLQIGIAMIY
jgi:hypothetical protein